VAVHGSTGEGEKTWFLVELKTRVFGYGKRERRNGGTTSVTVTDFDGAAMSV
jgi:hypothetical protein